jgi:hypothetical protein
MSDAPEFRVSSATVAEVAVPAAPHVIAVAGYAVVQRRSNGQGVHLTYKDHPMSQRAAAAMLARVHEVFPSAQLWRGPV